MAKEFFGYFDSVEGDVRQYDAAELAQMLAAAVQNGVSSHNGGGLEVTADGESMNTTVSWGGAVINGYVYVLSDDGSGPYTVTHQPAGTADRIDRVVVRLNMNEPYPNITLVSKPLDDGAAYFGPYGSRGVTRSILETIQSIFKLPLCTKRFPRDLQKGRVCLNYHMDQCAGWCQRNDISQYRDTIEQARQLLLGKYKEVAQGIRAQMLQASDEMNFELYYIDLEINRLTGNRKEDY